MAEGIKTYRVRLTGLPPGLLCHNGAMANPLNAFARQIKSITAIRKKTDEHHHKIAELEWAGGLYLTRDGHPYMPRLNIEGMLTAGAKKIRLGELTKSAVCVIDDPLIECSYGPKNATAQDLWAYSIKHKGEDGNGPFHHVQPVIINKKRVMRCRPHFRDWAITFRVEVDPTVLEETQIDQILVYGGRFACLGDYRPKYGKFTHTLEEME